MTPASNTQAIDDFFAAVAAVRAAYRSARFHFVALAEAPGGALRLRRARLFLETAESGPDLLFRSAGVAAGAFDLAAAGVSPEDLLRQAAAGRIETPAGPLGFGMRQAQLNAHHVEEQRRYAVLSLFGDGGHTLDREVALDWELRAASPPFDSLQELAAEFRVGRLAPEAGPVIEVAAFHVMEIDFGSAVSGTTATIRCRLARGLATERAALGYRELSAGRVVARRSIGADEIAWADADGAPVGTAVVEVSPAAALHCTAVYGGVAQHQFWVTDPSTAQNARRVAYEGIDPGLDALQEVLRRDGFKGRDARDLESAVSWLLWMLGFGAAHLGAMPKLQDAPDILATTPQGHFAAFECTTGSLRADNKLPKLIERAEALRRRLDAAGNRHLRAIAAIVTTRPRDEVAREAAEAERQRVLVVAREDLEEAVANTALYPDAERLFARAEEAIRANHAKHGTGGDARLEAMLRTP